MDKAPTVDPLKKLYDLIEKGKIEKDIEFQGTVYRFRSLNDEECAWRDQFIQTSLPTIAMFTAQRAPTLAIATVAINGVAVADLPNMGPTEQQAGAEIKYAVAYNLRKFYSDFPQWYIEGLHGLYLEQIETQIRKLTEEQVKNS
jgi:hypothetical protein